MSVSRTMNADERHDQIKDRKQVGRKKAQETQKKAEEQS
jgi:hypothetical protein